MFEENRYVTKGIQAKIPVYMQTLLWYMVEIMKVDKKCYFQVFELSGTVEDGKVKQRIIHRQESPAYEMEHFVSGRQVANAKVYIIDDGTHCTMLLAEEY